MPIPNHREAFLTLLGRECETCGERRSETLSLTPRDPNEKRRINILVREKEADLRALAKDFRILCFNCKAVWEFNSPEIRAKKKASVEKSRAAKKDSTTSEGVEAETIVPIVQSPHSHEEVEKEEKEEEEFHGSFNTKPRKVNEALKEHYYAYLKSPNPLTRRTGKDRLKFDFGINVDIP